MAKKDGIQLINRGYILLKAKPYFYEWLEKNGVESDEIERIDEGNIYLIEEDFLEEEPVIERLFKQMLLHELQTQFDSYPETFVNVDSKEFMQMFDCQFGTFVFDALGKDLVKY